MKIIIKEVNNQLIVTAPYHPDFAPNARQFNGKWTGNVWIFDPRDTDRICELLIDIYGTDGTYDDELVTIRVTTTDDIAEYRSGLFLAGRCVARAKGRDSGATLGEGVVFLSGLPDSSGSMKNWTTTIYVNSVFDIRDVPKPHALKFAERVKVKIGDEILGNITVQLIDAPTPKRDLSIKAQLAKFTTEELFEEIERRNTMKEN